MRINCNQCGEEIIPLANFCSYCGAEAPRKTVVYKKGADQITEPNYCPECSQEVPKDAIYCHKCGESIYTKPNKSYLYCPQCQEKNSINAKICCDCGLKFKEWFSMSGIVAENIGYAGELVLKEKMTGKVYHFLNSEITIGRNSKNYITIPCQFVSSEHCSITSHQQSLIDLESSNGTFINRDPESITNASLIQIDEFNIAGYFTFNFIKLSNSFIFRLSAILDKDECFKHGNKILINKLRDHYYILLTGNDSVFIRKMDGKIDSEIDNKYEYYRFRIKNNYYYFSDTSKNEKERLLVNNCFNLPVNWEMINN